MERLITLLARCLGLTLAVAAGVTCWLWNAGSLQLPHMGKNPFAVESKSGRRLRTDYRYSVVPGGVFSAEELRSARHIDRVVAEHYADFGANAVVTSLPKDAYLYVSYRKGDQVYWTSRKHLLKRGELVLVDGKHMGRARCGNRLSTTAMGPLESRHEPSQAELNLPELPFGQPTNAVSPLADLALPTPVDVGAPGPTWLLRLGGEPFAPILSAADRTRPGDTFPIDSGPVHAPNSLFSPGAILPGNLPGQPISVTPPPGSPPPAIPPPPVSFPVGIPEPNSLAYGLISSTLAGGLVWRKMYGRSRARRKGRFDVD